MGIYTDSMEHMEVWEGMVEEFHGCARAENTSDMPVGVDDSVDLEED